MANFNEHLKTGAIVGTVAGAGIYLYQYSHEKEKNSEAKFQWSKFIPLLLTGCALGALTGIAADKIEPSLSPNHRGFFHSFSLWILAGLMVLDVLSSNEDNIWKNLAIISFAGYSSHLALDMATPKSIPMFGV